MPPSGAGHRVVAFGMALAVLAYVDRSVIAQAAPLISAELGFDKVGGFLMSQAGGDWNMFIRLLAMVYFLGVPCWLVLDPRTSIDTAPGCSGAGGRAVEGRVVETGKDVSHA